MAFLLLCSTVLMASDFLENQKKYARVKEAYRKKESTVAAKLKEAGLSMQNVHILFVAFKEEKRLDLYAKGIRDSVYQLLASYDICAISGKPGPKRREGDLQIPEGFYHINRFNPSSSFYLSLGINYPNASDRIKGDPRRPGSDIFIHGACATVGCLPMTDNKIKEIYIYALQARNNGQSQIPVYIFPFSMQAENMNKKILSYNPEPGLLEFWRNLETGFNQFVKDQKALKVSVSSSGDYLFK